MTEKECQLNYIHSLICDLYGDWTSVSIDVDHDGMRVVASDSTNVKGGYDMTRINGEFVKRAGE